MSRATVRGAVAMWRGKEGAVGCTLRSPRGRLSSRPTRCAKWFNGGWAGRGGRPASAMVAQPDGMRRLREYVDMSQVGEGAYAVVYKATHSPTGTTVALKKCIDKFDPGAQPSSLTRELELMRAVRGHEHILELLDSFVVNNRLFIVLPFVPGGNLLDLLGTRPAGLTTPEAADLLRCLCSACAHLHALGVAHRDVKPENILIIEEGAGAGAGGAAGEGAGVRRSAKLCDFGEAVRMVEGADRTEYVSTRW